MNATIQLQPLTDALLSRFGASDKGLTAAVDLAVLVALADERIDEAEMAALVESVQALIGAQLAPAVAKHLVTESRAKIRVTGAEARARDVGTTLRVHGAGEDGVRFALAIALVSEGLADSERALIATVAESAGVSAERLDALVRKATPAGAA